jgi:hypothetical protein
MSARLGPPADSGSPAVGPLPQKQGHGCLKWGLISGGFLLVLGIVGLMFLANQYKDIDIGIGTVPTDKYDVTVETCEVDELGGVRAAGTITNTSNVSGREYVVHVHLSNADGDLIDTGETSVGRLREGQKVNWEITLTEVATDPGVDCEVDEITYSITTR